MGGYENGSEPVGPLPQEDYEDFIVPKPIKDSQDRSMWELREDFREDKANKKYRPGWFSETNFRLLTEKTSAIRVRRT